MFSVIFFFLVTTHVRATDITTTNTTLRDYQCQSWYNYDPANKQCVCINRKEQKTSYNKVECGEYSAIIASGYCTTYEEGNGTYLAKCLYFDSTGLNTTSNGYILPRNLSELNNYMCGQMNRKNRLCSDCIDGFAPSFTSPVFECSNCTGHWYGVPLYFLVELGPTTVLYLITAVFQISMTSAPMTSYIVYSQTIFYSLVYDRRPPIRSIVLNPNKHTQIGVKVIIALYGIWNLDPIRYLVPPFCISSRLKGSHIVLLGYVSAFYPLCLIFLTWACVQLHDHNFKPVVLIWRPIHKLILTLRKGCDLNNDLIGVFASFFFLSYTKLMYQSIMLLTCQTRIISEDEHINQQVSLIDPNTACYSSQNLPNAIPALLILIFCTILPSILFLLYSTRKFQACLSKCHLNGRYLVAINIFLEKYHSCCRDGLNGGKDMRIFSGFYFILRVVIGLYNIVHGLVSFWTYQTILFASAALMITIFKPYKKTHVNVLDALQLALTALICLLLSQNEIFINHTLLFVLCIIPAIGFVSYNVLTRTHRLRRCILDFFKQRCYVNVRNHNRQDLRRDELLNEDTGTRVDIPNYESIRRF